MLRAKNDGTLRDKNNAVFVDGCKIVWSSKIRRFALKIFGRKDTADVAMAHVWSVASTRDGLTRSAVLREIDSIKEE